MAPNDPKEIKFYNYGIDSGSMGHTFPDGVYSELLDGYGSFDVVKETHPVLQTFLESKGAWDLYISAMSQVKGDKGWFGYDEKKVAETLAKSYEDFKSVGIHTFYCTEMVDKAGVFKWVVYVDMSVAPDYTPECAYTGGHSCSIM